jgi:hypothetical protein
MSTSSPHSNPLAMATATPTGPSALITSPSKGLSQKHENNRQKLRYQFFLGFFCFIAFSGVFQRWEFKNTQKYVLQKTSCRKVFTKNSTKNPKPIFFLVFFYHVFGRFSVRGVLKQDYIQNKNLTPSLFRTLTHPPTTGVTDFVFLPAPWQSHLAVWTS